MPNPEPLHTAHPHPPSSSSSSSVGSAGAVADFVAGAIGGVAICVVTQPFDTVKVLLQSQPHRFKSSLECASSIVKQSPLALFRGMGTPLATIPLVNAIVFWAYGDAKRWMTATDPRRSELPIWQLAAAGAYAGVVNSSVVCPVELVKIQLQAQAADGARDFAGPASWAKHAWRTGGWRSAMQGMVPTVAREFPAYAGQFFVYEGLLRWITIRRDAEASRVPLDSAFAPAALPVLPSEATAADQLIAGGASGLAAWLVSYPLDVIKTRIQSLPVGEPRPEWAARHRFLPDGGMVSVARHIARTEGLRGFWRGFVPCMIPAFPANALGFLAYEVAIATWLRVQ